MLKLPLADYVEKYTVGDMDFYAVLKKLPRLDYKKGPWLCGGSLLRLMTNKPISGGDFDLYFPHSLKLRNSVPTLGRNGFNSKGHVSGRAVSYKHKEIDKLVVQLIYKYSPSLEKVLETFDFTVCQLGTDGHWLYCTQQALDDIADKKLRFYNAADADPNRVLKYFFKSYMPVDATVKRYIFNEIYWLMKFVDKNVDDNWFNLRLERQQY